MSFNTSRKTRTNSVRESLPFCSPFSKSKDMSDIFLDKKTIIKKLQKLMLQVKDLETKMFVSKMISYLNTQQIGNIKPNGIDIKFDQKVQHQKIQNLLFINQVETHQIQTEEIITNEEKQEINQKLQNLSLCPMLVAIDLQPVQKQEKQEEKDFLQTATSQGFFSNKRPSIHISNPIIQESFCQSSTIQCQCGLFQALLLMVSKFIKEEIIKNRQKSQDDCLEIDQQFVEEITKEVIGKFYERQNLYTQEIEKLRMQLDKTKEIMKAKEQLLAMDGLIAKESLAIRDALKQKEAQYLQAVEQIAKMNVHLKSLDKEYNECSKDLAHSKMNFQQLQITFSELQEEYMTVSRQKQQLEAKLSSAQKQIEKHAENKSLYQETKQHEIDALNFQLQLKNTQIRNMKTIVESLQKRNSVYNLSVDQSQKLRIQNEQMVKE